MTALRWKLDQHRCGISSDFLWVLEESLRPIAGDNQDQKRRTIQISLTASVAVKCLSTCVLSIGGVSCVQYRRRNWRHPPETGVTDYPTGQKIAPQFTRSSPAPSGLTRRPRIGLRPRAKIQASARCGCAAMFPTPQSSRSFGFSTDLRGEGNPGRVTRGSAYRKVTCGLPAP